MTNIELHLDSDSMKKISNYKNFYFLIYKHQHQALRTKNYTYTQAELILHSMRALGIIVEDRRP
ncbi:MAG: hypothetical protein ACYDAO_09325 [Thermoplasmataceae archaeon]